MWFRVHNATYPGARMHTLAWAHVVCKHVSTLGFRDLMRKYTAHNQYTSLKFTESQLKHHKFNEIQLRQTKEHGNCVNNITIHNTCGYTDDNGFATWRHTSLTDVHPMSV